MRDLDYFNKLEERAWELERQLIEGTFKDEQTTVSKGKFKIAGGDIYEGDIVDDKPNGKGKMTYADGTLEEGRFENNKFIGEE